MYQVIKACEIWVFIKGRLSLLVVQFHKFMTRIQEIADQTLLHLAE